MIKWILFDLAGVVAEMYWGNKETLQVNNKSISTKELYALYEGEIYQNFMKGLVSERDVLINFLDKHKISLTFNELQTLLRENHYFVNSMESLLAQLSKKNNLACLANEGREWVQYKIDKLDLKRFFKIIIESNQLKLLKPDVRFYKKALNILGAQPTECIFIDDKEMNCIGAEKIGIKSIVFKHSEQLKKELAALSIVN